MDVEPEGASALSIDAAAARSDATGKQAVADASVEDVSAAADSGDIRQGDRADAAGDEGGGGGGGRANRATDGTTAASDAASAATGAAAGAAAAAAAENDANDGGEATGGKKRKQPAEAARRQPARVRRRPASPRRIRGRRARLDRASSSTSVSVAAAARLEVSQLLMRVAPLPSSLLEDGGGGEGGGVEVGKEGGGSNDAEPPALMDAADFEAVGVEHSTISNASALGDHATANSSASANAAASGGGGGEAGGGGGEGDDAALGRVEARTVKAWLSLEAVASNGGVLHVTSFS